MKTLPNDDKIVGVKDFIGMDDKFNVGKLAKSRTILVANMPLWSEITTHP
ncbi:MAG: hypothetical protein ACR5K4_00685 [Sodalis sp. (in: enterobacteria)]